jgi:hypothetical protein
MLARRAVLVKPDCKQQELLVVLRVQRIDQIPHDRLPFGLSQHCSSALDAAIETESNKDIPPVNNSLLESNILRDSPERLKCVGRNLNPVN